MTKVGMGITNEGVVIFKDVTRHGLHRLCIEDVNHYPDLELWSEFVSTKHPVQKWLHDYRERMVANILVCHLWIFWKE